MDRFLSSTLLKGTLQAAVKDVISGMQHAGLVFASQHCPSCKNFLPFLERFRNEIASAHKFCVIYASSDRTLTDMQELLKKYPEWYALPWKDPVIIELADLFDIDGIPTVVVLRQDSSVVTTQGRDDIMLLKSKAWTKWCGERPMAGSGVTSSAIVCPAFGTAPTTLNATSFASIADGFAAAPKAAVGATSSPTLDADFAAASSLGHNATPSTTCSLIPGAVCGAALGAAPDPGVGPAPGTSAVYSTASGGGFVPAPATNAVYSVVAKSNPSFDPAAFPSADPRPASRPILTSGVQPATALVKEPNKGPSKNTAAGAVAASKKSESCAGKVSGATPRTKSDEPTRTVRIETSLSTTPPSTCDVSHCMVPPSTPSSPPCVTPSPTTEENPVAVPESTRIAVPSRASGQNTTNQNETSS
ncbi:redoxin family protein-like [Tropilaelaps mercedesae]|uniref:protein-disulfide reductase n=1 Tax=Tropilaelaps mercedesae TaxID=418985 RepID=A0A1V9XFH5_9ACAR|nr:redoxin family protein-like [Tropilaelaps mercedesae]